MAACRRETGPWIFPVPSVSADIHHDTFFSRFEFAQMRRNPQ
jgi:hypothetical protein